MGFLRFKLLIWGASLFSCNLDIVDTCCWNNRWYDRMKRLKKSKNSLADLTRKCLIEIKNLLYKSVLVKTAAVARHTKFHTIQHKTVTDNLLQLFQQVIVVVAQLACSSLQVKSKFIQVRMLSEVVFLLSWRSQDNPVSLNVVVFQGIECSRLQCSMDDRVLVSKCRGTLPFTVRT